MTESKKINKVAVYGSLRKNMGNWEWFLKEANYLGSFNSEPMYTMFSIGDMYPGLKKDGATSIVFEVYEVTPKELSEINILEGYIENSSNNHYDRDIIHTPYGEAYVYIYNSTLSANDIVKSGDWVKYMGDLKLLKNLI